MCVCVSLCEIKSCRDHIYTCTCTCTYIYRCQRKRYGEKEEIKKGKNWRAKDRGERERGDTLHLNPESQPLLLPLLLIRGKTRSLLEFFFAVGGWGYCILGLHRVKSDRVLEMVDIESGIGEEKVNQVPRYGLEILTLWK